MKRLILCLATIACCTLGFAKEPQRPETYNYKRGCELINDDQFDDGIDFLSKELQQYPKNGYAYAWMAYAYEQKEEYGSAINCLSEAYKYLPSSDKNYLAWSHDMRARIYWAMDDTVHALIEYTNAIKLEPKNDTWYEHRGRIYQSLKQWDKSDADYQKCIDLTPGLIRGVMLLGYNYYLQERYEEALAKYTYANQLAERSWTLSGMAECEVKLGKYEEAAKHVIESLKLESYERTAINLLTDCKNEDFVDLVSASVRVQIAKSPNAVEWMHYLVILQRGQKQYEQAIRTCQKIRKVYPDAYFDDVLADVYMDMGDWKRALQYENEAIASDTTDIGYIVARAYIYGELDSAEQMFADINRLIDENPDDERLYPIRGHLNLFYGRYQQAIEDYDTYLALDSKDDWERCMRGRCYQLLGNEEKAKKDLLRAENSESELTRLFAKAYLGKRYESLAMADSLLLADTIDYSNRYNVACIYAIFGEKETALRYLEDDLKDGNVRFNYLRHDPDFQPLHGDEFDQLIAKYQAKCDERINRFQQEEGEIVGEERIVEVPFTAASGVTKVDCTINGLPLNFIFDTGASDVSISQTEASFMYKNGYLSSKDIIGKSAFQTADGNISVGTIIMLNKINFGGLELTNVRASVVANQKAPLLLGQTVLQRLGKIEIDNEKKVLKITSKK